MSMKINFDNYKISSDKYYKIKYPKTQIILGGSLRKDNLHIKRYENSKLKSAKSHCTYSINRSGEIFQHYDPKYYTDYMGNKDVDKKSISVVLENMGMLYYDYESNKYLNWANDECSEVDVYEKKWNNHLYWEKYTENQYISVVYLVKYLTDKYDIELDSLGFNVFFDNTIMYEGIVTRSNYDMDYTDLNPSFDFGRFLKDLDIM